MTDYFIRYNVSILIGETGIRAKNPIVHEGCCLNLDSNNTLHITSDEQLVLELFHARAFPQSCGIKITGLEMYSIKGVEAFRHQELWCWMNSVTEKE